MHVRFPIDRCVDAFFDDRQCIRAAGDEAKFIMTPYCDFGHQVGPQFGNLWQGEPAQGRRCHLVGVGTGFFVIGIEGQLIEQLACARDACVEFSRNVAGEKLFHQLVKYDTAPRSGTDHLQMLNVTLRRHDAIERIAETIAVMLAGPAPDNRRRAFLNGSLLSSKNVGRLHVRPSGRMLHFLPRERRKVEFGNLLLT